jgi:hypothetical protein
LPAGDAIDDDCTVPKSGLPSLPHGIFVREKKREGAYAGPITHCAPKKVAGTEQPTAPPVV